MILHKHPYQGEIKELPHKANNEKPIDEFEVVALAKRLGITIEEMKDMTFVSLLNILISSVDNNESDTREATQEDIDKYFW